MVLGLMHRLLMTFLFKKNGGFQLISGNLLKIFYLASPFPFELQIRKIKFNVDAFFICIANSNQFGNNFTIAPEASLSDGLLDIIVVKKMSKPRILWSVIKQMKAGKIQSHEEKKFHDQGYSLFSNRYHQNY